MKKLTAVIPVCGVFNDFENNFKMREVYYKKSYHEYVDYLFVDSSEDLYTRKKIEDICICNGWRYIYAPMEKFNASVCRNIGIVNSNTEFIILEDIDLIHDCKFYKKIVHILEKWDDIPFNFISCPVAYLSKDFSSAVINGDIDINSVGSVVKNILNYNYNEINDIMTHYVPQSSLLVLKKNLALFIGLFDEEFTSWGGEDRDFVFRLLSCNTRIKLPDNFRYTSTENGHNISKYVGWKALWTMHGDYAYDNNLISFHIYHEERAWRDSKLRGLSNPSIIYANKKANIIGDSYYIHFKPYIDKDCNNFVIGRNPHIFTYELYDALNGFNLIEEYTSIESIKKMIDKDSNVIIWNPYGSSYRLSLFRSLKDDGYNVFVAERGALPDSIVIDHDLVIFSKNYRRELWDKPISQEERDITNNYLRELTSSDVTLEKNSERENISLIKRKLGLHNVEYVLLCCLQLASDTVTNQDVDGFISYKEYIDEIKKLSFNLPRYVKLIYKNHPLSKVKEKIDNAICVDSYHLHDLIEIANAVIVYNSGTGIIARAFKKPVFCFGPSSYLDNHFTYKSKEMKDVLDNINSLIEINDEYVIKYFSYLINNLYSFAKSYNYASRDIGTAVLKYPSRISYYDIKIHGKFKRNFSKKYFDPECSYLFRRFYNYKEQQKNVVINKNQKVKNDVKNTTQILKISNTNHNKNLNRSTSDGIKRKIKKLLRDPKNFFKDMKIFR